MLNLKNSRFSNTFNLFFLLIELIQFNSFTASLARKICVAFPVLE